MKKVVGLSLMLCFMLGVSTVVFAYEQGEAIFGNNPVRLCLDEKYEQIIAELSKLEPVRAREFSSNIIEYSSFNSYETDDPYLMARMTLRRIETARELGTAYVYMYTFYISVCPDGNSSMNEYAANDAVSGRSLINCRDIALRTVWWPDGLDWQFHNHARTATNVTRIELNLWCDRDRSLSRFTGDRTIQAFGNLLVQQFAPPGLWISGSAALTVHGIRHFAWVNT